MASDRSSVVRWQGRLMDVQGFEGEVTLDLRGPRGKDNAVEGTFEAAIGVNHHSSLQQGKVVGKASKSRLNLRLTVHADPPLTIELDAGVQSLRDGGRGLCGTYSIQTRGHSALQEGVAVLSSGRRPTSVAIEPSRRDHEEPAKGGAR